MHIHHFSRILAAPFGIGFAAILYFSSESYDSKLSYLLIPLGMILMTIYVFHNQLDLWWAKNHPINLDPEEKALLSNFSPFYNALSDEDKTEFDKRVQQFIREKEFIGIGKEQNEVPYDFKLLSAMIALEISFYSDKPLYDNYDKILFYGHPFPSPRIPQLHTVETFAEDGVIILAMDHLSTAIREPNRYYHVGYHAFAEAFVFEHPRASYPEDLSWEMLERISNFPRQGMMGALGLPAVDLLPIGIYMYFVFGDRMHALYPVVHKQFSQIFKNTGKHAYPEKL